MRYEFDKYEGSRGWNTVNLDPCDLLISTYRNSSSAVHSVRVTHLPTGLSATGDGGRTDKENRNLAEVALVQKILALLKVEE